MEKYLVRKKVILDDGLTRDSDRTEIIPFNNMVVATGSTYKEGDEIKLGTQEYINEQIKASVVNSHKVVIGEYEVANAVEALAAIDSYNAGGTLTFTNGSTINKNIASAGEVFFFVPKTGSTYKSEEIIVGTTKDLIPLTDNNLDSESITQLQADVAYNTKNISHNAAVLASYATTHTNLANEIQKNADNITALDTKTAGEIAANKASITSLEPKVDANTAATADYFDNKADFVRIQDIEGAIDVDADITGVESGTDVTFDISGLDLSKLVADKLAVFKFNANNGTDPSEYVSDSYNNATATPNILLGQDVTVTSTDTLLTVSGLGGGDRDTLVNDYKLKLVSQVGGAAGASIDQVARTNAAKAQAIANTAKAAANTNTASIATNTASIANKQDKIDNSLATTTKSVVGAINEVKQGADLATRLGGLATSDGDDLSTTTETIVTEKTLTAKTYVTKTEMDAAIAAALATVMDVSFDDGTAGKYKIGKD